MAARRSKAPARADATPVAGLGEARLHRVLGYQVAQASVVAYALFDQLVGKPLDLRPAEYTVLTLVNENPDVSPAELSAALAVSRPYVTNTIDKLSSRGLVRRDPSAHDRRSQHLQTTDAGRALASRATTLLVEGEKEAFTTLSEAEQMMLAELLHKLACVRQANPRAAVRLASTRQEQAAPAHGERPRAARRR
jgi:DNA-binding MarR family transcriptional regulator